MEDWRKVPCKEWQGAHDQHGYGKKSVGGKKLRITRLTWAEAHGPIPKGMCVLHRCDNPPCYELAHLFLGTKRDNALDAVAKGRWGHTGRKRKLDPARETEIRQRRLAGALLRVLAKEYGVSEAHVSMICNFRGRHAASAESVN